MNSLLFLAVEVSFHGSEFTAIEDDGGVEVCVLLIGDLERNVTVTFATFEVLTNGAEGMTFN